MKTSHIVAWTAFPLALLVASAGIGSPPVLDTVEPSPVRVGQLVTLRGSDFGSFDPGQTVIQIEHGATTATVLTPYVWRDDFIQLRLPTGITEDTALVSVDNALGSSGQFSVTMARSSERGGSLAYAQRTQVLPNGNEVSGFLGPQSANLCRTKDADIGDINGDGFPDIIDNNSNNQTNGTHEFIRINQSGTSFTARAFEPLNSNDTDGPFATTVPPGGDYIGNSICYDADLIDLNNDERVDWVQAASSLSRMRVVIHNATGRQGAFTEATSTWAPGQVAPGSPDDVCSSDVNGDGLLDVAMAYRFSSIVDIWINDGGTAFEPALSINHGFTNSIHDSFFINADGDAYWDMVLVNEFGDSRVFFHNGSLAAPGWIQGPLIDRSGETGVAADFNADGLDDFAIAGQGAGAYLNRTTNPGNFLEVSLPGAPVGTHYDSEVGDVDLDGDLDLLAAIINTTPDNNFRLWENDGTGVFTNMTSPGATAVLPGSAGYQRLSADLIDFDMDGDLDLYLTGADGAGAPGGSGLAPNQFWENGIIEVWGDVGNALDGTNGTPTLDADGSLFANGQFTLTLDNALENTTCTLVLGFSALNAAFKQGVLVPSPDIIIAGLPTGPSGNLPITVTWPTDIPSGVSTWWQYWINDPAGPAGFAASNGVIGTTP